MDCGKPINLPLLLWFSLLRGKKDNLGISPSSPLMRGVWKNGKNNWLSRGETQLLMWISSVILTFYSLWALVFLIGIKYLEFSNHTSLLLNCVVKIIVSKCLKLKSSFYNFCIANRRCYFCVEIIWLTWDLGQ